MADDLIPNFAREYGPV